MTVPDSHRLCLPLDAGRVADTRVPCWEQHFSRDSLATPVVHRLFFVLWGVGPRFCPSFLLSVLEDFGNTLKKERSKCPPLNWMFFCVWR